MSSSHRLGLAGPLGPFVFWVGRKFFSVLFRLLWRRRVIGLENVPRRGSVILASNHASNGDPPIVGSCIRRPTFFMAKKELFDVPVFGWLIKQCNAFPIRRLERDLGAFKMSQRILLAGEPLIMFPEGTRQREGKLGTPKPGVGLVAIRSSTPVIPVYVHNSHRLMEGARITVVFGAPISPEGETDPQVMSDKIMAGIRRLKETHFQGA